MSTRLFAVLFTALFLIGAFPILFVQPFGSASAGITAGFMVPIEDIYHVAVLIAIGLASAWIGGEVILVLPLCTLLILTAGALAQIPAEAYPAIHYFIAGTILLFSLSISLIRRKSVLLCILPIAAWTYFAGNGFMQHIPSITTPLFFMIGIIISNALVLAIGVALGITLTDNARESMQKFKNSGAFASFWSLF